MCKFYFNSVILAFFIVTSVTGQGIVESPLFQTLEPLALKVSGSVKYTKGNSNDSTYITNQVFFQHTDGRQDSIQYKAKEVSIREFEITNIQLPVIEFRVTCSKGTYIRSLANDFGKVLNTGAYLQSLCRTRIGEYLLKDALEIKDFAESELVLSLKSQKTKEA